MRHNPPNERVLQRLKITLYYYGFLSRLDRMESLTNVRAATVRNILNRKTSARDSITMLARGLNVDYFWLSGGGEYCPWWYPETKQKYLANIAPRGTPDADVNDVDITQNVPPTPLVEPLAANWRIEAAPIDGQIINTVGFQAPIEPLPFVTEPADPIARNIIREAIARQEPTDDALRTPDGFVLPTGAPAFVFGNTPEEWYLNPTAEEQAVMDYFYRGKATDGPDFQVDIELTPTDTLLQFNCRIGANGRVMQRTIQTPNGLRSITATLLWFKNAVHGHGYVVPTYRSLPSIMATGLTLEQLAQEQAA